MNNTPEFTISSSGLTTRIALLSLLWYRPMHGYEIRQVMELRQMHRWANIQYGSIYRGLQQLAREGWIDEAGEERAGNRPPRTIYQINDVGRAELKNLLLQAWAQPTLYADPIDMAMTQMMLLSPDEIRVALEQRLQAFDALSAHIDHMEAQLHAQLIDRPEGIVALSADLFEHRRSALRAEHQWTQHILQRLGEGAYHLSEQEIAMIREYRANFHPPSLSHPDPDCES
ncbi:MAG: PadR family transcriptional regulator [Anaerolineae bacterium]|nr:PadR family transcriptional regulator [Anaerolineae bacterium]